VTTRRPKRLTRAEAMALLRRTLQHLEGPPWQPELFNSRVRLSRAIRRGVEAERGRKR